MAWNGSKGRPGALNAPATGSRKRRIKVVSPHQCIIVCFVIAVGVVVAVFSLLPSDTEEIQKEGRNHHTAIGEVAPAISTQVSVASDSFEKQIQSADPNARPTRVGEHVNGYVKLASGRIHKIRGEITNDTASVKADYEIFDRWCDNEIACLLTLKPGDTIVGDPPYRGRLTRDFLDSLQHPIIINKDDSEHDRELKRAVRDTKIELKAAMDQGEDLEKIMLESREECRRLAEYKRLIQEEVRNRKHDDSVSSEDYADLISAANKMLEDRGIEPLHLTPLMRRKLMMDDYSGRKE